MKDENNLKHVEDEISCKDAGLFTYFPTKRNFACSHVKDHLYFCLVGKMAHKHYLAEQRYPLSQCPFAKIGNGVQVSGAGTSWDAATVSGGLPEAVELAALFRV